MHPEDRHIRTLARLIPLGLFLAALGVYWPVQDFGFVAIDDQVYVTENAIVQQGLTWDGFFWTLQSTFAGFWHPMTWLSLMLDVSLFGLNSGGFHVTNLLLHVASTLLLFFTLRRMTGATWRSALVAALFAVHPQHVESVAWISERKDVLSTFFLMLTLRGYAAYVERPSWKRYAGTLLSFLLGIMAKSMLVTLPFALLLLDVWPLRRIPPHWGEDRRAWWTTCRRLLWEKVPLFGIALASCQLTVISQREFGSFTSLEYLSWGGRLANAVLSAVKYLGMTLWPMNLSVFYPLSRDIQIFPTTAALAVLVAITFAVYRLHRSFPYLAVGWLWYLGTLVPVSGIVSVGIFAMADRYTYVPHIGLFLAMVWGIDSFAARWHRGRLLAGCAALAILIALGITAREQVYAWRDSEILFLRTLAVTQDNVVVHHFMGNLYYKAGQYERAVPWYARTIQLREDFDAGRHRLGLSLANAGRHEEALPHFEYLFRRHPMHTTYIRFDHAQSLTSLGRTEAAVKAYRQILALEPDNDKAWHGLGYALERAGQIREAADAYRQAYKRRLDYTEAYNNQGVLYLKQRKPERALPLFRAAVVSNERHPGAWYHLGVAQEQCGQISSAVMSYRKAVDLEPRFVAAQSRLGNLYLAEGQDALAREHCGKALAVQPGFREAAMCVQQAQP